MTPRETVIKMIRDLERQEIRTLAAIENPTGSTRAYTVVVITRDAYRHITAPPTKHRQFMIRTTWDSKTWTADKHWVMVKRGAGMDVVGGGPGLFGANLGDAHHGQ